MRHTYHTYKINYDVNLKGTPGSFCTSPLEIMMQMNNAQNSTLQEVRKFLREEKLQHEVTALKTIPGQIGLTITCSDAVAAKIAKLPCVRNIERFGNDPKPQPPRASI